MPDPSNPTISINLTFGGGLHSKPTVSNPTTQSNTVPATQTFLRWQATPNEDGVQITGVAFYQTQADKDSKANPYSPPYLDTPGGHDGTDATTWKISFNSNAVPNGATLWYDVQYEDDDWSDLDWDPRLTISPR